MSHPSPAGARGLLVTPGSLPVVAAALLLVLTALAVLFEPGQFLKDDSYFYLQIAHNIVQGEGSTFHGITPTNGYHPLWMAFTVAAAWLAGGDKGTTLLLVVAMQTAIALGVAVLFAGLVRRMGLEYWLAGVAIVLSYLLGVGVFASEAHLNMLLLTAGMLSLWHALSTDRPAQWALTGVLLGFAILARLDNLFVCAAVCGLGVLHDTRRGAGRIALRAGLAAVGTGVVVLPYLALNWVQYGHLMPISGALKSTFPVFDFEYGRLGAMGKLAAPFGVVSLLVGLFLDRDGRRRVIWWGLGIGVIVHALYVVGFTDHYTFWAWYYVAGVLAAGLVVSYVPGWLAARTGSGRLAAGIRPVVIIVTLAVLAGGAARAWLKAVNPLTVGVVTIDVPINEYRWQEEVALWLKEHLPPGSGVFVYDWPGALAWYSNLRILPMDGLVNDFAYNDDVLAEGASAYLCRHGVSYYFGLIDDDRANQEIIVPAPLYRRSAGTLSLRAERLLVKSRDVVARPDETLPFALWELDCPQKRT